MSGGIITILGVGIALAGLILNGQRGVRAEIAGLRGEIAEIRAGLLAMPAALRSVCAASQHLPHPHHWCKLAVIAYAALLLMTGGNARAQGTVEMDRAALVALYNETDGANWADNTNWLSTEALSEWYGVTTDDNGRVTELTLYNKRLSGEIPAALGNLTNLHTLVLEFNQLSGGIPAALGDLASLQILDLCGNRLSGRIPAALGNLTNLSVLHLYDNQLSGGIPAALGDLASLQLLTLYNNQLSGGLPATFGDMPKVRYLYLNDNPQLTGTIPPALDRSS